MTVENHILTSNQLIDFAQFANGNVVERQDAAKAILHGFQTAGFIYLKNLPIDTATLSHVYSTSAKFFKLPTDTKMRHCWTTPEANRGYSAPGREKVSVLTTADEVQKVRESVPDIKESYEIGREGESGHPNQWPEERGDIVGFKSTMLDFFDTCKKMHEEVMRAIAVGMGLNETVGAPRQAFKYRSNSQFPSTLTASSMSAITLYAFCTTHLSRRKCSKQTRTK